LLKRLSFLHHMFLAPLSKISWASCVGSYPDPLFYSTGLHICFCASTMLVLLLWLCSILWSRILWYLQHCSFCSVLGLCLFKNIVNWLICSLRFELASSLFQFLHKYWLNAY
jgi:hypothetical protein